MDFTPDLIEFPSDATITRTASLRSKWGDAVGEGSGFVAVPLPLLRLQVKLGLTPTDMLVLINLLAHWWNPTVAVFPRTTTIARRMGVNERTVQRSMRKLIRLGLAERGSDEKGRRTYQFKGLVKRLNRDLPAAMRLAGTESLDV
jgi:predicted transcriptional regulator